MYTEVMSPLHNPPVRRSLCMEGTPHARGVSSFFCLGGYFRNLGHYESRLLHSQHTFFDVLYCVEHNRRKRLTFKMSQHKGDCLINNKGKKNSFQRMPHILGGIEMWPQ